jgi:hypothetical protein
MKPDWDKLGKHFSDVDGLVIVDVDCTAGGKSTCENQGVQASSDLLVARWF